jgi:hypothetical protein
MIPPCFRGPDVAVVGWIPYFDRIKDLPAGHNYQASRPQVTYQFKLSPIMDNLQRLITGRWAPNAWAAIEYEILQTGLVRIATTGTAIPSQGRLHKLEKNE